MCNYPFREETPIRRNNIEKKNRYQDYKQELREDFNKRCGYCNDHEGWRNSYYEIDHFVPKALLSEDEYFNYSNLVFSCRYCNNSKRMKWPTGDRDIPNDGRIGFIDPCSDEYEKQFERNLIGEIIPKTIIGEWMYKELKFYLFRHSLLCQLDKINNILKEFRKIGLHNNNQYTDLFIRMSCYFQDYIDELREDNAR